MDYLNEVRCNGIVYKWPPVLIQEETPPKIKFTIEVARPLKMPVTKSNGVVEHYSRVYWKCTIRAYVDMLPLFETARNLRVGQGVYVRGQFYFSRYSSKAGVPRDFYGIMVREIDLPHTKDQDSRVQELIKKTIIPWKDKLKNIQVDEYGQKTITDGAIGEERIKKQEDLSFCDVQRDEGTLEGSDF
jgi:hypothetical protein